jgi:Carboxypeptidase regulatory-like domain
MRCALLLASVLAVVAVGCDGHTSVQGRVLDPEGKPIPQASVKFTQQPDNPGQGRSRDTTTNEEGRFETGITHAPTKTMPFLLEVGKEGFVRHEERLTGTASYEKEIVLQPMKK